MNYKYLYAFHPTLIKIDIDTKKIPFFTKKGLQYLSRYYSIQKLIIKKSPSKQGFHIIVALKEELTDFEIIAWQFAIGSDKKRERFNLLRAVNGNPMKEWNLLFNNKDKRKVNLKFIKKKTRKCHICNKKAQEGKGMIANNHYCHKKCYYKYKNHKNFIYIKM